MGTYLNCSKRGKSQILLFPRDFGSSEGLMSADDNNDDADEDNDDDEVEGLRIFQTELCLGTGHPSSSNSTELALFEEIHSRSKILIGKAPSPNS